MLIRMTKEGDHFLNRLSCSTLADSMTNLAGCFICILF